MPATKIEKKRRKRREKERNKEGKIELKRASERMTAEEKEEIFVGVTNEAAHPR